MIEWWWVVLFGLAGWILGCAQFVILVWQWRGRAPAAGPEFRNTPTVTEFAPEYALIVPMPSPQMPWWWKPYWRVRDRWDDVRSWWRR